MNAIYLLKNLKKEVKEFRNSEDFKSMLDTISKFHRYSLYNTILIKKHYPNATLVKGLKQWNALNRKVKAGEKGIPILVPMYKKMKEINENGDEIDVNKIHFYVVRYVFDISQTIGTPLKGFEDKPFNVSWNTVNKFFELAKTLNLEVKYKDLGLILGGYLNVNNELVINSAKDSSLQFRTLVHEIAHHCLDHLTTKKSRNVKELEAESVVYLIFKRLNLDTSRSVKYISSWADKKEYEPIEVFKNIKDAYNQIINYITS